MPVSAAVMVTGTVVGAAVAWPDHTQSTDALSQINKPRPTAGAAPTERALPVSRSADRVTLEPKPEEKTSEPTPAAPTPTEVPDSAITDHKYLTAPLNVWTGPGESYTLLDVLDSGSKVAVTGNVVDGQWAEISYSGLSRYVNADYLVDELPKPETPEPEPTPVDTILTSAVCPDGTAVEDGLVSNAVTVYRSVCDQFSAVDTYGGYRSDGEHADGTSLDIMVYSNSSLGDQIASWLRANASKLNVREVIWSQHIWTVERSSEGWRLMEDRGSTTANHYDHVHVRVYS